MPLSLRMTLRLPFGVLDFGTTCSDLSPHKEKEQGTISKKKLRKLNRLTVAQLKQLVDRPDVVEMHDVTAHDPKLLIHLKVTDRHTVLGC